MNAAKHVALVSLGLATAARDTLLGDSGAGRQSLSALAHRTPSDG